MKTNMLIFTLALGASTCLLNAQESPPQGSFTIAQTISDFAQQTTLAFDGLAMITGNMDAQSFFPPGKVADYTGFQYLRDNDPDNMGHNTSFLTRIANNVIYILNDSQFAQLVTLWPVPDGNEVSFSYYRLRQIQDANFTSGQTVDVPYLWMEAFAMPWHSALP